MNNIYVTLIPVEENILNTFVVQCRVKNYSFIDNNQEQCFIEDFQDYLMDMDFEDVVITVNEITTNGSLFNVDCDVTAKSELQLADIINIFQGFGAEVMSVECEDENIVQNNDLSNNIILNRIKQAGFFGDMKDIFLGTKQDDGTRDNDGVITRVKDSIKNNSKEWLDDNLQINTPQKDIDGIPKEMMEWFKSYNISRSDMRDFVNKFGHGNNTSLKSEMISSKDNKQEIQQNHDDTPSDTLTEHEHALVNNVYKMYKEIQPLDEEQFKQWLSNKQNNKNLHDITQEVKNINAKDEKTKQLIGYMVSAVQYADMLPNETGN